MGKRTLDVAGRKVALIEAGKGRPLVYLHGFADVHGVAVDLLPFHHALAEGAKFLAPALPGVNGSDELEPDASISDAVFHCLSLLDALGHEKVDLVGHCVGGWLAAEVAAMAPERVARLALIGTCGLFVPGEPIGDIFLHVQPDRGFDLSTLRHMLFSGAGTADAKRYFPDLRGTIDEEVRRYEMLRFASQIGFKPPYLYNRALRARLARAKMPAAVLWGESDHFVPRAHGEAYAASLSGASGLTIIEGAGHAAPLEQPQATAEAVKALLAQQD